MSRVHRRDGSHGTATARVKKTKEVPVLDKNGKPVLTKDGTPKVKRVLDYDVGGTVTGRHTEGGGSGSVAALEAGVLYFGLSVSTLCRATSVPLI